MIAIENVRCSRLKILEQQPATSEILGGIAELAEIIPPVLDELRTITPRRCYVKREAVIGALTGHAPRVAVYGPNANACSATTITVRHSPGKPSLIINDHRHDTCRATEFGIYEPSAIERHYAQSLPRRGCEKVLQLAV